MKNKIILILFMVLSCGKAYALPQDWPCQLFKIEKYKEVENDGITVNNIYRGQNGEFALEVNVFWRDKALTDDCGTSGCSGTIKNIKTGKEENLYFFCDAENNYNMAKCHIRKGEEVVFTEESNENYVIHYCSDDKQKTLRFNKSDCNKCHCRIYDYEGNVRQNTRSNVLGCKKDKDEIYCMTGNVYVEKYNPTGEIDDFKNCVNLTSF